MRQKGLYPVPSQVTINAPIKILNLLGAKKCIVIADDRKIKRVRSIKKVQNTGASNIFKTVDKELLQPLFTQTTQTQHTPTATHVGNQTNGKIHPRNISALETSRKGNNNIHDAMLYQELQVFREEVEWKYKNSTVNKAYKFPFTGGTKRDTIPDTAEPNYSTILANAYIDLEDEANSITVGQVSKDVLPSAVQTRGNCGSVKRSYKKAEHSKKEITNRGTCAKSPDELRQSNRPSSRLFQTQCGFLSPKQKRAPSDMKIVKTPVMKDSSHYLSTNRRIDNNKNAVLISDRSKEDLCDNNNPLTMLQKELLEKVRHRAKTRDRKEPETASDSIERRKQNVAAERATSQTKKITVTSPKQKTTSEVLEQLQTIYKPAKPRVHIPFDIMCLGTVHDLNAVPTFYPQKEKYGFGLVVRCKNIARNWSKQRL